MPSGAVRSFVAELGWIGDGMIFEVRGAPESTWLEMVIPDDATVVAARDSRRIRIDHEGRAGGEGVVMFESIDGVVHARREREQHLYVVRIQHDRSLSLVVRSGAPHGGISLRPSPSVCGNGLVEGREDCDDANEELGDGCAHCGIEAPVCAEAGRREWRCQGQPSSCETVDCSRVDCPLRAPIRVYPRLNGARRGDDLGRIHVGETTHPMRALEIPRLPCEAVSVRANVKAPAHLRALRGTGCDGSRCEIDTATSESVVAEIDTGRTTRQWERRLPVGEADAGWTAQGLVVAFRHAPFELDGHRLDGRMGAVLLDSVGRVRRSWSADGAISRVATHVTSTGDALYAFVFHGSVHLGQHRLHSTGPALGFARLDRRLEVEHAFISSHARPGRLTVVGMDQGAWIAVGAEILRVDEQGLHLDHRAESESAAKAQLLELVARTESSEVRAMPRFGRMEWSSGWVEHHPLRTHARVAVRGTCVALITPVGDGQQVEVYDPAAM